MERRILTIFFGLVLIFSSSVQAQNFGIGLGSEHTPAFEKGSVGGSLNTYLKGDFYKASNYNIGLGFSSSETKSVWEQAIVVNELSGSGSLDADYYWDSFYDHHGNKIRRCRGPDGQFAEDSKCANDINSLVYKEKTKQTDDHGSFSLWMSASLSYDLYNQSRDAYLYLSTIEVLAGSRSGIFFEKLEYWGRDLNSTEEYDKTFFITGFSGMRIFFDPIFLEYNYHYTSGSSSFYLGFEF
jgi:hypothetical protein